MCNTEKERIENDLYNIYFDLLTMDKLAEAGLHDMDDFVAEENHSECDRLYLKYLRECGDCEKLSDHYILLWNNDPNFRPSTEHERTIYHLYHTAYNEVLRRWKSVA